MDNGDKRALYNGFGDALARAVEFVAVPAVFGILGHLVDGLAGTEPLFTVVLVVFALAGTFVRSYYAYEAAMKEHEARATWRRSQAPPAPGGVGGPTAATRQGWAPAGERGRA
ncbi:MAG: AtpZ/AtpI family protein [Actinomycetota bacterium]|nr:AtpZ/AtpI family protein [Actinomycetota bacterium]